MCVPMIGAAIGSAATALGGTAAGTAGTAGTWATMGTMAKIGTVAQAVSGITGAVGAYQQAAVQKATAQANAKAMDQAAAHAIEAGNEKSELRSREGARLLSEQKAAMAANGIDVSSASAIELLDDTRDYVREDALAIRTNAERQASGYGQSAANYRTEASNTMGGIKAASTLLGTATKVSDRWAHYSGGGY